MNNPVIYVFINKSLRMSVGKAAAQAAHAVVLSLVDEDISTLQSWRSSMHRTIIVLAARDENHMNSISRYLFERKFDTITVIDEGVNEIDPHTATAMATPILEKDDENVIKAFSSFDLYRDQIKLTLEMEK